MTGDWIFSRPANKLIRKNILCRKLKHKRPSVLLDTSLGNRKGIWPAKVLTQQCFWLTMTTGWQYAVSKSEMARLSQEGCSLEVRQQASSCNDYTVPEWDNILPPWVRNTVILQCFDAIGRQQDPACKSSATTIPRNIFLITGLTCSNSRKTGRLNKQESPAIADKPARSLRKVCTVYVRAVGL